MTKKTKDEALIDRLAQYLSDRYDVILESGQEVAREILAIVRESRQENSVVSLEDFGGVADSATFNEVMKSAK